ncbi:uncharacterized protein N7469_008313 [Penicillium citrinum]|uniref:Zn(2)-C6 fungal-type domain-containing protein n=2 Tax=Penicillium TaxID=5073 RepID=A0A9W9TKS2_PENCI|nr:uncharacterized protein N7469_008313 [Penicillium citrinum]KAJ5224810.1 hypothetical protein N7469_008313 [Penicillium citrinum]KAJ5575066.1 hypothetical protein N7450_008965 [Penicillium hetheringtonii]
MESVRSSYAGSRSRKSHTKSRLGCGNCKKRRIKCDEDRPQCMQCIRHSVKCNYSQASSSSSPARARTTPEVAPVNLSVEPATENPFISSSQSAFVVPKRAHNRGKHHVEQLSPSASSEGTVTRRQFQFTASDMILFHHCLSAEDLKDHLPDELIRLGFSVQYVMHLLLAIAGFHLNKVPAKSRVERFMSPSFDYYVEAERHLSIAIADVTAISSRLHEGCNHSIYIAAVFIFICSLARGPQSGEYLCFRDDNDIPAIRLFHGLRSIIESINNIGSVPAISEIQPRVRPDQHQENMTETEEQPPVSQLHERVEENGQNFYSEPLKCLQNLIMDTFPPHDLRHSSYVETFELLVSRYDAIFGSTAPVAGPELWPQIFGWLYMLPDIVTLDMQQRHPIALLLFSYFTVLLYQLDFVWFIKEWPSHILKAVSHSLEDTYQPLLSWPLKWTQLVDI